MQTTRYPARSPAVQSVTLSDIAGPKPLAPLYQRPGILVTQDWFIVGGRRFPVGELHHLHTARGPAHQLTVRSVTVTAIVLAAIGITLGMTTELNHLSAQTYLALTAVAFVPFLVATIGHRLRPRAYELWGQFRGMTVLLFSSDEQRQYGQVTRALLRAQEAHRLGGLGEPLVSTNIWHMAE
ncbi:hypothetical protein GCM10022251_51690 [Phytohabitans flavus]|uniref:Uncharacterized protein n=1 Tax=Phytohabitans flavus TaxID=1076124 RepID=A0A6F8Y716_9ACTN|nr:DUF6232 family protein [Phytohabitans flavus]BCB81906.1 hypothetical protein Pflav_083160 [Phytohabitans flavus]